MPGRSSRKRSGSRPTPCVNHDGGEAGTVESAAVVVIRYVPGCLSRAGGGGRSVTSERRILARSRRLVP